MISITCSLDYPNWSDKKATTFNLEDDIHIWRVASKTDQITASYSAVLSAAEIERANRFYKDEDKWLYITCHYALRKILAAYTGISTQDINFITNQNNKPFLNPDLPIPYPVYFNISHSGTYSLIALAQKPVGIDIELIDYNFDFQPIFHEYFTTDERAFVNTAQNQTKAFYTLWTRKEAFYKGVGSGIIANLTNNSFLDGTNYNNILQDNRKAWILKTFNVDKQHIGTFSIPGNLSNISYFNF